MNLVKSLQRYYAYTVFESSSIALLISSLLGISADLSVYYFSLGWGLTTTTAHLLGFLAGALPPFLVWIIALPQHAFKAWFARTCSTYVVMQLLALFMRAGVLATCIQVINCSPKTAIIPAACISAAVILIGTRLSILRTDASSTSPLIQYSPLTIALIAYAVVLRLFCSVLLELIFEEAYYWNYAQHLDIGYLDHPPMVGWLIFLFTSLLGDTEFAVRVGSFLCWCVTAYYTCKLAKTLFDKQVALNVLLLLAVLPIFFGCGGLVMQPDAPLLACWAGVLYYLYRALIENHRGAWLGVGIFMGLGMLSKYTICLLGLAAFAFILFNSRYRKWLLRPEPYLATLLAILLFSPVIIWNANHGWVSFLFQSAGRIKGPFDFALPDLMCFILFLLTPTGAMAAIATMWYRKAIIAETLSEQNRKAYCFLLTTTILPIAVFFFISFFRSVKLDWTAPLWLGILPYMAALTLPGQRKLAGRLVSLVTRAWPGTIAVVLITYGGMLHYSALGFPGVPYPQFVPGMGMEHLAAQIESIVDNFQRSTNEKPLVVCTGKNKIASLVAFYRAKIDGASGRGNKADIINNTTGSHFFGNESLMYAYWHPVEGHRKRIILLIGYKLEQLESKEVQCRTDPIGDIRKIEVFKNGELSGRYFYQFLQENTAQGR